jgi:hypothetical protein
VNATIAEERHQFRASVLEQMGASGSDISEMLRYGNSRFLHETAADLAFPLSDEPFVETWTQYAKCREAKGSISFLRDYLVQLRFPIREGLSKTPAYKDVTLRGRDPNTVAEAIDLRLAAPEKCRIVIHSSAAGRIPLLIAGLREDFVALAQALTGRNEPIAIPDSMGACCIAGYNNWHRISLLRREWEHRHTTANTEADWLEELQRHIIPQRISIKTASLF